MVEKPFESIEKADIDALITDAVEEGGSIEYKQQLPGKGDEDTREFLADVSSFANAGGGDMLYGVVEKQDAQKNTGVPEIAKGLSVNKDQELLRLENCIRDGIDPRIPGVCMKAIDGFVDGPVILIRIPKSWSSPHMVKFKNTSRFYSRNSKGKYQLDVREIRSAFLASDTLAQKMTSFRTDRVSRILGQETPVPLQATPSSVLHLLPVAAFANAQPLNLKQAYDYWQTNNIRPPGQLSITHSPQYNFNGLYVSGGNGENTLSYIQLFRNGAIEIVNSRISLNKLIYGISLEQDVLKSKPLQTFQAEFQCGPPLVIGLTLLRVKGLRLYPKQPDPMDHFSFLRPIDENVLIAPDTLIGDATVLAATALKPAFDALWQASGWPESQGYDQNGNYLGMKQWL